MVMVVEEVEVEMVVVEEHLTLSSLLYSELEDRRLLDFLLFFFSLLRALSLLLPLELLPLLSLLSLLLSLPPLLSSLLLLLLLTASLLLLLYLLFPMLCNDSAP